VPPADERDRVGADVSCGRGWAASVAAHLSRSYGLVAKRQGSASVAYMPLKYSVSRLFVRRPAGASAGLSEFASTPAAPSIPHMMLAAATPPDWSRSRRDMGMRSRTITSECKEL